MEFSGSGPRPTRLRDRPTDYGASGRVPLRLVYIPTHRDCAEVLHAVVEEIAVAATRSSDEFQLLLIDDRSAALAEPNRLAAAREAEARDFAVNWLDVEGWREFVDSLVTTCGLSGPAAAVARDALLKPSGSYAGGMNKASLIAAYLGADTLHRRDSDEFPARDDRTGVTTLEVEIATLGGVLPTGTGESAVPFFAGSSVEGEPTKDHRDLDQVDERLGEALDALSSRRRLPGERRAAQVTATIEVGSRSAVELRRDVVGRTQVGISASREVFRWIPEMPAVGVLGTDHFQKGLLYQVDLPVYWHPLSAFHEYEPWRADQTDHGQLGRYAVSELRYAVLRHYWNKANETLRDLKPGVFSTEGEFLPDVYADAFVDALTLDGAEAVASAFVEIYQQAATRAVDAVRERLLVRLAALREERPDVVPYVRAAIREFIELTRLWPRLVRGAEAMGGFPR